MKKISKFLFLVLFFGIVIILLLSSSAQMMVSLIIIQGYAGLKQIIIEFFFQISRFDILFLFLTCLFYSPILVIIHSVLTGNTKNISDISFSILFFSFISFVIITIFSSIIRKQEFHKLAERSMPLIQAIKQYSQDHNHPPKKLKDLVPDYLPKIPTTGIEVYPHYEYEVKNYGWDNYYPLGIWGSNPWILYIETPTGMEPNIFFYLPNQNYPTKSYNLEKIKDWAYLLLPTLPGS